MSLQEAALIFEIARVGMVLVAAGLAFVLARAIVTYWREPFSLWNWLLISVLCSGVEALCILTYRAFVS
jgi:hypothetical protein